MSRNSKDICELFGYAPDDLTPKARTLWEMGGCPFLKSGCTKHNHDQSIIYGTCSVSSPGKEVIICPNRLYANNYQSIKLVAEDAFGKEIPFYSFKEFIDQRTSKKKCVVALGQNSGKEVKLKRSLSMDWILALIDGGKLVEYLGIEVQSIDITGNYRDAWNAYKNLPHNKKAKIPASEHGLNWANVHKRLIPQLIRKGVMYSRSKYVKCGLYFVIPDEVYKRFEDIIGDIPRLAEPCRDSITVHTYALGNTVPHGQHRPLELIRKIRFKLEDFSARFISGPDLPPGSELDNLVKKMLNVM